MYQNVENLGIYFYDLGQDTIDVEFNTYMNTVRKETIRLYENSTLIFKNPITKSGILLEVFPVLSLARTEKTKYYMNIYLNAVKIISRRKTDEKKISKSTKRYTAFFGINSKEVITYNDRIVSISDTRYSSLNRAINYIMAQILYEAIENKPFLLELSRKEEKEIKILKYYISKGYNDYRYFIKDYMLCRKEKIEKNIAKNTDVKTLEQLEEKIKGKN